MVNTRTDSPTSRRIVLAFLQFLKSVEPAPGVDPEALDVARDCLEEVFKVNSSSSDNGIQPDLLWDLFSSRGGEQQKLRSELGPSTIKNSSCISSTSQNVEDFNTSEATNATNSAEDPHELGVLKDELFGNFYAALDKINFFTTSPGGIEDPGKIAKATQLFNDALVEMENSGQKITSSKLAETFKSKGNQSMQLKLYSEAIELYTCAIALCERNAIYYCNRAAAYTQIHRYSEAIEDCLKSIKIDPSYSKAYSRLGMAYFAQGDYINALKSYMKALELDPDNNSTRENIRVTEQKMREHLREERDQRTRARDPQGSTAHSAGPTNNGAPFTSFPTGASTPEFFTNMFRSMASGHGQDSATQSTGSANGSSPFTSFPINVSIPPEFANMFGGMASSHGQESMAQSSESTNQSHSFTFPSEFANMFTNVASATQTHQANERTSGGNVGESNEPGVRVDANVNLNIGEAPEQVSDVLRSVMGMFSSQMASQGGRPQGTDRN